MFRTIVVRDALLIEVMLNNVPNSVSLLGMENYCFARIKLKNKCSLKVHDANFFILRLDGMSTLILNALNMLKIECYINQLITTQNESTPNLCSNKFHFPSMIVSKIAR